MFSLTILMNNLRLAGCPVTGYLGKMVKCVVQNFVSLSVNIPFLFCAVCAKFAIISADYFVIFTLANNFLR